MTLNASTQPITFRKDEPFEDSASLKKSKTTKAQKIVSK